MAKATQREGYFYILIVFIALIGVAYGLQKMTIPLEPKKEGIERVAQQLEGFGWILTSLLSISAIGFLYGVYKMVFEGEKKPQSQGLNEGGYNPLA